MKKIKLTGIDGEVLAVANTKIGLIRAYNKILSKAGNEMVYEFISLDDLANEITSSIYIEEVL